MADPEAPTIDNERIKKEAPLLVGVLKEMKQGLDNLRNKIDALTSKVRDDHFPTTDGISYLEAKHLLLLNYCQSLVYYLLRKAKGLSIEGHPVVRSLVEIRLFLEKIRPIDKRLQFQLAKFGISPCPSYIIQVHPHICSGPTIRHQVNSPNSYLATSSQFCKNTNSNKIILLLKCFHFFIHGGNPKRILQCRTKTTRLSVGE